MLTRPLLGAALGLWPGLALAQTIELDLPIACTLGRDCWIQQYFDHDAGPNVKDYACGLQTYDGHDGTDIRIQDTADEAEVIASAPGIVKGTRNSVEDRIIRSAADKAAIANIECGNGVLIEHEGGWQTQYCHMRQGSVMVKEGDKVERGTPLGLVGYSGDVQFPHVHLSVRKDGKEVDPFKPVESEACGAEQSLWSAKAQAALDYEKGAIIGAGFAPGALKFNDLEEGRVPQAEPATDWPALVFYGWAINLAEGSRLSISVEGPDGFEAKTDEVLDRHKAQYFLFAGKKRPQGGWPVGTYVAKFTVTGSDGTTLEKAATATIQ
jgi:hypothetical protein